MVFRRARLFERREHLHKLVFTSEWVMRLSRDGLPSNVLAGLYRRVNTVCYSGSHPSPVREAILALI